MKNRKNLTNIRYRLRPKLYDFSYIWCRSHLSALHKMIKILYQEIDKPIILDIGCGDKPLQDLFPNSQYLGVDISSESFADWVLDCNCDKLPIEDNSIDAVIMSNSLEHIYNTQFVIKELTRVLKKKGLVFFSVPMTYPIHAHPHDYLRFTPYFFKRTFSEWNTIENNESNSLFSTPLLLCSQIIATFFPVWLTFLPTLLINTFVLIIDKTLELLCVIFNSSLINRVCKSCPIEINGIFAKRHENKPNIK